MNDKTKFDPDWIKTDAQKLQIWKDISAEQQETIAGLCKEIEELKRTPDQGAVEKLDLLQRRAYSHADKSNCPKLMREWIDSDVEVIRQALTRPPLDLEGLKDGIIKLYDERQGYDAQVVLGCERNAIRFALDHLQAIRPDIFGGK